MLDAETKGERAAQILENEVYQEASLSAREKMKEAWTKAATQNERETLWHQYQATEAISRELRIIRDRGIIERDKRKE